MKLPAKIRDYLVREEWSLAIRRREGPLLWQEGGTDRPFTVIPNTLRYWAADPFLFTWQDRDWLFFEMFDRFGGKGVIGCREITGGRPGPVQVALAGERHLSFPFLFREGDQVFMLPESSEDRQLRLYRAVRFPCKWEAAATWLEGRRLVDSVLVRRGEEEYLFTQELEQGYRSENLHLYVRDGEGWTPHPADPVVRSARYARMAGGIRQEGETLLRPAQDCSGEYGKALHFFRVEELTASAFREELISTVTPEDLHVEGKGVFTGVHTYNCSGRFEVIDLKNRDRAAPGNLVYLARSALFK